MKKTREDLTAWNRRKPTPKRLAAINWQRLHSSPRSMSPRGFICIGGGGENRTPVLIVPV